jgi:hypothetical protein
VIPLNVDADPNVELGMMFSGADRFCTPDAWGVQLWQTHEDGGDQGTSNWSWTQSVYSDAADGVVAAAGSCSGRSVMDAEIVRHAPGKYVMFNNIDGYIYASGSGFACSNFVDDDGDGLTDYGPESAVQCQSPTDDAE